MKKRTVKDFIALYAPEDEEKLVLIQDGVSADKTFLDTYWAAHTHALAMADAQTGQVISGRCYLSWPLTDKERDAGDYSKRFIGGLFDEELCFVYADSVSELLGHPEPVYRGYSSTAQHRMLVIPEEHWSKALKLLYAEKFDWSRLVYDITYTSIGAAVVEDFYDENVVFLRFCFEKELLKKNPLDRYDRILRMVYLNQDLTNTGKNLFPELLDKFLAFYDRKGKTSLETMLKRWYTQLEKEYHNHIEG